MSGNLHKIDRHYTSPYDDFLNELRQKLPETQSQAQERIKAEKISEKRDNANLQSDDGQIWSEF